MLSSFHQQVLLYWKLIYKHNYRPHNTPLWNCCYIKVRNKSIFVQKCYEKDIWSVTRLLNDRRNNLFEDFRANYNLQINNKEFEKIIKAIPQNIFCTAHNLLKP